MQQSASWTEPRLCHYQYDMSKAWLVHFEFTDHLTGEKLRKQYRSGINKSKVKSERIRLAKALCIFLSDRLSQGWNPITNEFPSQEQLPDPDIPLTIAEAFAKVLTLKKSSLKSKSYRNYSDISGMFTSWAKSHKYDKLPLVRINSRMAQAYLDYLLTERHYSGKSHNGQLGILKSFCNVMAAKGREWIKENPFVGIAELPETVGGNIAYTEAEAKAMGMWLQITDIRVNYARLLLGHCFIRKTELCELKVSDIDWKNRTIKVSADSSKNRIQDSVTIPEGLMATLEEMDLRDKPGHWYIFGHRMETCEQKISKPDIISYRHKHAMDLLREVNLPVDQWPMHHKKAKQFFLEHEEEAKIICSITSNKTFYSWKHTGVVMYWNVVKDVYFMMRQLRHHDMKVTMVYLKSLGLMPNEAFRNANVII